MAAQAVPLVQIRPAVPITCPTCAFFASLSGAALTAPARGPPENVKPPMIPVVRPEQLVKMAAGKVDAATVDAAAAGKQAQAEPAAKKTASMIAQQASPPVRKVEGSANEGLLLGLRPGTKPVDEDSTLSRTDSAAVSTSIPKTKTGGANKAPTAKKVRAGGASKTKTARGAAPSIKSVGDKWTDFKESVRSNYLPEFDTILKGKMHRADDFELSSEVLIPESLTEFVDQEGAVRQ